MFAYKKLQNNLIAKLEICGRTNEGRPNLTDPQYAPYRAEKVKVLSIYNPFTTVEYNIGYPLRDLYQGIAKTGVVYRVGEYITVTDYDKDVNKIDTTGIHYFKTEEQALYWLAQVSTEYVGEWKSWCNNGQLAYHVVYEYNKDAGKSIIKYLQIYSQKLATL